MDINGFAKLWDRPADNNFAAACYNDNSINELKKALSDGPDETDMNDWGISEDEWTDGIRAALFEKENE
jgi:hypothetical protein